MNNEEVYNFFLKIMNYCKNRKECKNCIFSNLKVGCIFANGDIPFNWELALPDDNKNYKIMPNLDL